MKYALFRSTLMLTFILSACNPANLPNTALFAGVDGTDYEHGQTLIQNRLALRFPQGMPAGSLADYLEQQGLQVDRTVRSASYKYGTLSGCGSQVRIDWETSKSQSISKISTLYDDTGCL